MTMHDVNDIDLCEYITVLVIETLLQLITVVEIEEKVQKRNHSVIYLDVLLLICCTNHYSLNKYSCYQEIEFFMVKQY